MKKILSIMLVLLCVGFFSHTYAQKVLVTDDASFSSPSTLLHVHKTATSGDIFQLTNGSSTGTGSAYGFKGYD